MRKDRFQKIVGDIGRLQMNKKIKNAFDEKLYWILIIISPFSWKIIFNIENVVSELFKIPLYFRARIEGIFSEEKLVNAGLMRWAEIEEGYMLLYSKFLYNRLTILIGEFFDLLTYYSPRFFFQSGDGSNFTPQRVEPVPVVLFPFFLYGFLIIIKKRKFRLISAYIVLGVLPWIFGVKSFSYLFPLTLVILYFVKVGFEEIKNRRRYTYLKIVVLYGFYLLGRMIWLI